MPRRVWTYPAGLGWDTLNLVSTVGAFVLAAGVLVFLFDLARNFRPSGRPAGNLWRAGTLEWLPTDTYSTRSIPHVTSRDPLWDQPALADEVAAGAHYLPDAPTGGRETLVTSAVDAKPQYVLQMPGNGWPQVLAAVFTAACFLLLTVKLVVTALACAVLAIVFIVIWLWPLDPGPAKGQVEIGAGIRLPTYMTGSQSHGWWAMVVLMLVAASLYLSYIFSYLYLWTVSPDVWPQRVATALPPLDRPLLSAALCIIAVVAFAAADRWLPPAGTRAILPATLGVLVGCAALVAAVTVEIAAHWQSGLRPQATAYGAMVYLAGVLAAQVVAVVVFMGLFIVARLVAGRTDRERRNSFDHTALLAWYAAAQTLLGLALVHGFPRLVG
jgi:cytochrome c oxidase subunit I+III